MKKFLRKAMCAALSAVLLAGSAAVALPQLSNAAVTVNAAAALTISSSQMSLGKGEGVKLTANQSVTWRTSAPKILTVDKNGNVKAVGNGTAWITARSKSGSEKSCKITVKNAPSKVTISQSTLTLGVGESYSLSAKIPDGTACATRTFRTSNPSVVKMTKTNWTGSFTALKTGTVWVTVRTYNGKESSCKITVKNAPKSVDLSKKLLSLKIGDTANLSAILPADAGCASRTFRTSNPSIVKMTKTNWSGSFKAMKEGIAWVTVRTYNGKEASCKVVVSKVPVTSIKLNKTTADMKVGQTLTLTVTVSPANATNKAIKWSSTNPGVATVTAGKVKAVGAGQAKIAASTENGKVVYCIVNVKAVTGFTKLQDKIAAKPDEKDSNGNYIITGGDLDYEEFANYMMGMIGSETPSSTTFRGGKLIFISYNKEKDSIAFVYADFTSTLENSHMIAIEPKFNQNYNIEPQYVWIGTGSEAVPSIGMKSKVNAKQYTWTTTLPFTLTGMDGYNVSKTMEKKAEKYANEQLTTAMKAWDQLIYSRFGMHMKDIGFDKL